MCNQNMMTCSLLDFLKASLHFPKVGWIWKSLLWVLLFQRCCRRFGCPHILLKLWQIYHRHIKFLERFHQAWLKRIKWKSSIPDTIVLQRPITSSIALGTLLGWRVLIYLSNCFPENNKVVNVRDICQRSILRIPPLHFCRGIRSPPTSVLYITSNHLMVKQQSWSSGEYGVPLQCHYFQVYYVVIVILIFYGPYRTIYAFNGWKNELLVSHDNAWNHLNICK